MVPVTSAVEGAHACECVLLLRARMAVAALAMRGAHFWVVFASQDAKLAGSLRFVGRKMQFHQIRLFGWQFGWQFGFS